MKFTRKFIVIFIIVCSCIPPVQASTRTSHYIIIKQSEQKLYYTKGKLLLKLFSVTIRHDDNPTLTGRFTVVYKEENIVGGASNNQPGTKWLGLNIYETEGKTYGIHGTNPVGIMGMKISARCIQMNNADVELLYAHVEKGTPVIIQ
ncbi:hypothetical protein COF09_31795 [Bacillus toyonensis]|uniref:L,D-transpeptidase n=1 Tax=Bacillus toyonensis TaxID=155322 RepID=UPI000BFC67E5|nr:L,D-transpeptidase [Bacillus toyonensis]PHC34716.1 hypothetical protein COF09_31795 [Bacillus toyonensis]